MRHPRYIAVAVIEALAGSSMSDSDERFCERLARGPAGLLLGQRHLALGSSSDPLLAIIQRKLAASSSTASPYDVLFASAAEADPAFLEWLDTKSRSLATSEQLAVIAQYQWVAVWSSAIDNLWADAFDASWRETQKIFSEDFRPPDPRNRRRLHCTFLFGSTSRVETHERAPLTRLEYLQRRGVSLSLARRIPAVVGPTGTLAIEAYNVGDWFSVEDLVSVITQMLPDQCHIFNSPSGLLAIPEIQELVSRGLLGVHERPLASVLYEANQAGILKLGVPAEEGDLQRLVSFEGGTRSVPRDLWTTLSTSAHLLDESVLGNVRPLSEDARYAAFRRFLGSAEGRPDWEGIAHGFAFRRAFESGLEKLVRDHAAQRVLHERPIVLHGATGTGKTMALTSLAYNLAQQRTYPVVFVDRTTERFDRETVDRFCQWVEDQGATGTVVVWDGMRDVEPYEELSRYLAGRGRRVVLVGSTYRIQGRAARLRDLVLAPAELRPSELPRLEDFLGRFDERLTTLARIAKTSNSSFLAFLYRLLPPTRVAMRRGVVRELERVEQKLIERSLESGVDHEPSTALGWALLDAGLLPSLSYEQADAVDIAGERFSAVEDLTALVMVPAQFGLTVPLELVLRATGREGYEGLPGLLQDLDLVRWVEDRAGNFLLTARSSLEAQIIVRSRLGTTDSEIAYTRRLIMEVKDRTTALSGPAELGFAVGLIRSFSAPGIAAERYLPQFPMLAAALSDLREEHGVSNPRLMLQEAHLLREWAMRQPVEELPAKLQALTTAAGVLDAALELVQHERRARLRSSLNVELASTLGAHAQALSAVQGTADERVHLYADARVALLQARVEDSETYHPVDVLAWTTMDILRANVLGDTERAEAIAEVLSAFDLLDPLELAPDQVVLYNRRRQQFGELIGNADLADEAFDELARLGSGAGVYIRARSIADPSALSPPLSIEQIERIQAAISYLDDYHDLTANDPRCLNLRFDLWWLLRAGQKPFADERYCLPFDANAWRDVRSMIEDMQNCDANYREVPLLFLRGLAEFHLREYGTAFTTFGEVTQRSDEVSGRRRIVRSYLAATSDGRPIVYNGTVGWISDDLRRGAVYVDRLHRRLTFIPREFGRGKLTSGSNLGEFHIAFNFLGVIADPPGYFGARREAR
jgi:hypothetical protein